MMSTVPKILAITLGDPEGIGPEVIAKSLNNRALHHPVLLIGSHEFCGDIEARIIRDVHEIHDSGVYLLDMPVGSIAGDPSFHYVKTGVELSLQKKIHALVTGPISKERWLQAGVPFPGHTDYLAQMAGVDRYIMFFWSSDMRVALYSTHIPLREIFSRITEERIVPFVQLLDRELERLFGGEFTILVSGLNPHAGEQGVIGSEELDEIIPAIEEARKTIKNEIIGPFPPDTVLLEAQKYKQAVVVSWYHDQGLIPFKLLNIHTGVNMTLGLPFIRTSPDHGTAFEIAGKGVANPSSMKEAINLAELLMERVD